MTYNKLDTNALKSVNGGVKDFFADAFYTASGWVTKGLVAQGKATDDTGKAMYGRK
ncbi:hypothetical protein M4L38_07705 [Staphylococcus equorum]|uniref:hypothetical protein n=1 Tax=Staphylococcus equorum TaxID=246432 RepID=UPI002407A411|nr:hypothetical protein [Staphylococcus equorum]MDG0822620.1 hypothetical protein [Staphylococcus equorum]